jgi:tetratricopeptide (TPR) repeat protein
MWCLWISLASCGGTETGLKSHPNKALHFDLAELFLTSNAYDAASPIARKLYNTHPNDPRPPYYLGVILRERGVFEEAERYFLESIKRDAQFALAYDALGVLYGVQSRLKRAIAAHQRATEIDPKNPKSWHNLGFALTLARDYQGAIKAYQKSITLAPNHKKTYVNLGMTYGVLGQDEEAARMFKQALSPAQVWYNLGVLQERRGDLKQAHFSFDEALKIEPQLKIIQQSVTRVKQRIKVLNDDDKQKDRLTKK